MISPAALQRDIVIAVCAISAGIHVALVREHLEESAPAGVGFLMSAVLLAGLVVVLTYWTASGVPVAAAGAVLVGLLASYAFAATTGIPVLHPEVESIDGLALATKAIEAFGVLAALLVLGRGRPIAFSSATQTKGARS
jgi:hypothetical protein